MLPYRQNRRFYGRKAELDKINQALDRKNPDNAPLRTYTIYGRRGVGKTELALQYAYTNPANFDAIFWIGCETALSLRRSFTNMAMEVKLPGADKHGRKIY
jgi:predicted AAA+ superfamily ATPase